MNRESQASERPLPPAGWADTVTVDYSVNTPPGTRQFVSFNSLKLVSGTLTLTTSDIAIGPQLYATECDVSFGPVNGDPEELASIALGGGNFQGLDPLLILY